MNITRWDCVSDITLFRIKVKLSFNLKLLCKYRLFIYFLFIYLLVKWSDDELNTRNQKVANILKKKKTVC